MKRTVMGLTLAGLLVAGSAWARPATGFKGSNGAEGPNLGQNDAPFRDAKGDHAGRIAGGGDTGTVPANNRHRKANTTPGGDYNDKASAKQVSPGDRYNSHQVGNKVMHVTPK